jgi:hypothetical protein
MGIRFTHLDKEGKADGIEHLAHASFFVASVGNQRFLVTAGHVLQHLDRAVQERHIRVESYFFVDYLGHRDTINYPVPFPYETEPKFYIDDEALGIDFGFIPIRELFKEGMKRNGITPISEKHWSRAVDPSIAAYWMLGFPEEVNRTFNEPIKAGEDRKGVVASVIISADRIEDSSQSEATSTTYPRFVGRINVEIPFGIKGMSGGPIFGLTRAADNLVGYTVVALQSRWQPSTRTIYGCPIRVFGEILTRYCVALPLSEPEESRFPPLPAS